MKLLLTSLLLAVGTCAMAQQTLITTPGGCATVTPPRELAKIYDFVQHNPEAYRQRGTGAVDSIPLSIHIVGTDAGGGYYQLNTLFTGLCQLNTRFAPTGFHFYIQWPIQYINNTSYYQHDYNLGEQMMWVNNVPNTVNVYFVQDPAGNCGYYTYSADAVAIGKGCAGNNSTTLTHELGHYFSLPHTFSGWEGGNTPFDPENVARTGNNVNCSYTGDGFCDTWADYYSARWACPGPVNKLDAVGEPYHLDSSMYMSYSLDVCQSQFSPQQMAAMQYNLHVDRNRFSGAPNPPARPLDSVRMSYPKDTLFVNYQKATWKKVPGADYYYVRISLQSSQSYVLQSALVSDTFLNITGNFVNNGRYLINITPVNAHDVCMKYTSLQTFIYSSTPNSHLGITSVTSEDALVIAPNPLLNGAQAGLQLNQAPTGEYEISLYNLSGQQVGHVAIHHAGGIQRYALPTQDLAPGLYVVRVKSADLQLVQKLLIQQ